MGSGATVFGGRGGIGGDLGRWGGGGGVRMIFDESCAVIESLPGAIAAGGGWAALFGDWDLRGCFLGLGLLGWVIVYGLMCDFWYS